MSTLRPLENLKYPVLIKPAADIGTPGELKWIELSRLYVDPTYQRAILDSGKANIRRMIEGFSWLQFGTLTVGVRPEGKFAIIDGQHRATAARLHGGIKSVPCLVLTGGPRDEARAFSSINGNVTRIHALQSFRAKVAAGDAGAVELVQICRKADVTIAPYPKTELNPGETLALGAVRAAIARHGERFLVGALRILRAADPDAGIGAPPIIGTAYALTKKPEWIRDAEKLGRALAARGGAKRLQGEAQKRRLTRGGTEWSNYAALIADAITMAQRAGSIPASRLMAGR